MCSPRTGDSVGHPEEWYRAPWDPTGLCLPCAWQIPNALSVYVGGGVTRKVMQFLYALQGLKSFHPYPILLVGLALGANSPGALVIRVLGLHHQKKKKMWVYLPTKGDSSWPKG